MTLNDVMTTDVRYICSSWASCRPPYYPASTTLWGKNCTVLFMESKQTRIKSKI